jgi:hypothetical protein
MNVDLTGESQHGFKKNRSTTTASISIQMALAKALEQGHFALMASLDLSSAFDQLVTQKNDNYGNTKRCTGVN